MPTKAELTKQNTKLKVRTDSRLLLLWSIIVMALGLFVLITTPFFNKWFGISFENLDVAKVSLPSGWGMCAMSLAIQLIDNIPEIIAAIKRVKK